MHYFCRAFVTCYLLSFSYSIEGQEPPVEWPSITLEEVASIPGTITDIADAKDGSGRLFVVEKSGGIFIVKDGILLPETFLVVTNNLNMDGEYGLLGMAFAPDFKSSGEFYVSYVRRNGRKVVSRLKVGSTPDKADAASETELLSVLGYSTSIHAGGQIAFGPDGYLYIANGEAGQSMSAQQPSSLLGKLLRIDVSGGGTTYKIPATNPFIGRIGYKPEIWAVGLRNPWRFSFDSPTGDMYLGDVGGVRREEVNFQPAASVGGENYGWPYKEGTVVLRNGNGPYTEPVTEYPRENFIFGDGVAVIGGYVNRESPANGLYGIYLFGYYGPGTIWGLKREGDQWVTGLLGKLEGKCATFGQDEAGGIYVGQRDPNKIFRIREGASFRLGAGRNLEGEWEFRWETESSKRYILQRSADFGEWIDAGQWVDGTGGEMIVPFPPDPAGFFRVAAETR